ncbi:uncharacterized protein N7459_001550 [Penicillium hispanicum]|uniref:uncharacterized protein n=1 Tax=Penicillium hispanicum TaxID=1080232 RepID=UPI0025400332|nr:uncharacterized protein N7459_001550 [Penicillium hispanicum]KAJ5595342.1 hypothetical protein N7459_001550 [Penicillium hispanicum]
MQLLQGSIDGMLGAGQGIPSESNTSSIRATVQFLASHIDNTFETTRAVAAMTMADDEKTLVKPEVIDMTIESEDSDEVKKIKKEEDEDPKDDDTSGARDNKKSDAMKGEDRV